MKTCRSEILFWTLAACLVLALTSPVSAAVFTVTNTADSGPGSLRQAIADADGSPGIDTIDFAIPGDGVQTIQLSSTLIAIFEGVLIDGYSQPGASPNTNPPGQGFNTVIKIEVRGAGFGPCFTYSGASGHVLGLGIQGLAINNCTAGILVTSQADHVQISGNFIGTDASGTAVGAGSLTQGIEVDGAASVDILSNLVSNVSGPGIVLNGASFTTVSGNLVGTNAAGGAALPNFVGISVSCPAAAHSVTIGGNNVVSGNLDGIVSDCGLFPDVGSSISGNLIGTDATGTKPLGNRNRGVVLNKGATVTGNVIGASGGEGLAETGLGLYIVIQGNFIGTDATATLDLGNGGSGLSVVSDQIGGTGPGEGNVIAHNGHRPTNDASGILATGSPLIRGNRFFDNGPLGIDLLGSPGVTINDPGDLDGVQNFPLITSVLPGASSTHIEGRLNSQASQTFTIDLYSSPLCPRRPNDYLQGETLLGSLEVTTDGFGNATFATDVPVVLPAGQLVTATATWEFFGIPSQTSEFSQRILFSVDPLAGPAGATATLSGMEFETGATVMVGVVPATNVVAVGPQTITATMPGFPAGTLHAVTVAVPSGLTGTLPNGWLANFTDVPTSHNFHDYVARLVVGGVSAGVGGGNYGVDQPTLREQMAVFLLKGKHGTCYVPPPCTGVFADVPCPATPQFPYSDWIEALFAEGITAGCGNGDYCPAASVTRAEMAVFLLKSEHGAGYPPPSCTGLFADVPCPATPQFPYSDWVEQLHNESITAGCHINPLRYCPDDPNTRGQMAVFIVRTFGLP